MAKKLTNVDKTVKLLKKNPETSAQDIVDKFNCSKQYAYNLLSTARKRLDGEAVDAMVEEAMKKSPITTLEELKEEYFPTREPEPEVPSFMEIVQKQQQEIAEYINRGEDTAREEIEKYIRLHEAAIEHDEVNSPAHYTHGNIETIDFIEAKNLNYRLGNVVKYVSRSALKGDTLKDLKKAQWYLNREIEAQIKRNEIFGS